MSLRISENFGVEHIVDGNDYISHRLNVLAKTANYTVVASESGTLYTNRGATGTVTFTLPAVDSTWAGVYYYFICAAAQRMDLSAATAGQMVSFNDVACNTLSWQTASEILGGGFLVICDGTSWLIFPIGEETQSLTITT